MGDSTAPRKEAGNSVDDFLSRAPLDIHRSFAFLVAAFTVGAAAYHIFGALFGSPEALTHRTAHVSIFLVLAFLFHPLGRKTWKDRPNKYFAVDIILLFLTATTYVYSNWDIDAYALRSGDPNVWDTAIGTLLILLLLEAVRRTVGPILVFVPVFFFLHTLFADRFYSIFYAAPTHYKNLVAY